MGKCTDHLISNSFTKVETKCGGRTSGHVRNATTEEKVILLTRHTYIHRLTSTTRTSLFTVATLDFDDVIPLLNQPEAGKDIVHPNGLLVDELNQKVEDMIMIDEKCIADHALEHVEETNTVDKIRAYIIHHNIIF